MNTLQTACVGLLLLALARAQDPRFATEQTAAQRAELAGFVDATVAELGADLEVSVFVAGGDGAPFCEYHSEVWRPAASAIKTAYLVELLARYDGRLDLPLGATWPLLAADSHPTIAHFDTAQRAQIRESLHSATPRTLAATMIHGRGVPNVVYNAAANLVTALCGGPAELEAAILARAGAPTGFAVRRYMLAPRDVTGDNELQVRALGVLWQRLVRGAVPGLTPAAHTAAREILRLPSDPDHYFKSGSLDSDPPCRLVSGCIERDGAPLVYALAATTRRGAANTDALRARLGTLNQRLLDGLLERARVSSRLVPAPFAARAAFEQRPIDAPLQLAYAVPADASGALAWIVDGGIGDEVATLRLSNCASAAISVQPASLDRQLFVDVEFGASEDATHERFEPRDSYAALRPGGIAVVCLTDARLPHDRPQRDAALARTLEEFVQAGFTPGRRWHVGTPTAHARYVFEFQRPVD